MLHNETLLKHVARLDRYHGLLRNLAAQRAKHGLDSMRKGRGEWGAGRQEGLHLQLRQAAGGENLVPGSGKYGLD